MVVEAVGTPDAGAAVVLPPGGEAAAVVAGTEVDRRGAPGTAVDGTAVVPAGTAVAGTPDVGAAVVLTPGGEAAAVVAGTEVDREVLLALLWMALRWCQQAQRLPALQMLAQQWC